MGRCTQISKGKLGEYHCPNEIYSDISDNKCLLHSGTSKGLNEQEIERFGKEFREIIRLDAAEVVFQDIVFPEGNEIKLPEIANKPLLFNKCNMRSNLSFGPAYDSISFTKCFFQMPISIKDCTIQSALKFEKVTINNLAIFDKIEGEFIFHLYAISAKNLSFENISFERGFRIILNMCGERCRFINIRVMKKSILQVKECHNEFIFKDTDFLRRTDIIGEHVGFPTGVWFDLTDCCLDNLYAKDLFFEDRITKIKRPRFRQKPTKILRNFRSFYKNPEAKRWCSWPLRYRDPEFDSFVLFLRRSKDYFANHSEHIELYDNYYRLSLFFSRLKSGYQWQKRIANNIYRYFSNYGYSIWRPIIWLVVTFAIFNSLYSLLDYRINEVSNLAGFLTLFANTLSKHLSQIIFRGSSDWVIIHNLKLPLFVLEIIVMIPIFASIINSIRKVFKRF